MLHVPVVRLSVGLCAVGVPAKATQPAPLFFSHDHTVGLFVDASVNVTLRGVTPESGAPEKAATGVSVIVTINDFRPLGKKFGFHALAMLAPSLPDRASCHGCRACYRGSDDL